MRVLKPVEREECRGQNSKTEKKGPENYPQQLVRARLVKKKVGQLSCGGEECAENVGQGSKEP